MTTDVHIDYCEHIYIYIFFDWILSPGNNKICMISCNQVFTVICDDDQVGGGDGDSHAEEKRNNKEQLFGEVSYAVVQNLW